MASLWKKALIIYIFLPISFLSDTAFAIGGGDIHPDLKTCQESLQRWRSLRVGAFIHWTPYVLSGPVKPAEGYDNLYKRFEAENFNPAEWVRLFEDAGFKYIVYTTKHGDSCCMWDTKETDYNIMNSPMGRDVVGGLTEECKKQGMPFCAYYALRNDSQNHPDFTPDVYPETGEPDYTARKKQGNPAAYHLPDGLTPDFERYVKHVKAQLKELSDNYGPFLAWWFDQRYDTLTHKHGGDLYAFLRSIQSDVLTSNRVDTPFGRGLDNPTWFVTEEKSAGDFAVSEIAIPRFNRDIPWEYCQVAGSSSAWFWRPDDIYRPLEEWIKDIVNCACRDGNFILGIGPMPDGRFQPRHVDQLRQLGVWLRYYGESIYGTRGGPFKPNSWYGSTCKGNVIYVHVFKTDNGSLTVPPINKKVLGSRLLNGGTVAVEQTDKGITLTIGKYDIQPTDTIVALELDGSAEAINPVEEQVLTSGVLTCTSNVRENKEQYSAEMTCDGNRPSFWTTDEGVQNGWLEYDLGKPCTFSRAILDEWEDGWIRHVQIQAKIGEEWKTVFEYRHGNPILWEKIPMALFCPEFRFESVNAQFVRVNILAAIKSPVVHEFKLYER